MQCFRTLALATVCVLFAHSAVAQQITVCVRPSGKIYSVPNRTRTECRFGDTTIALNVPGPQGPAGPTGPPGPAGVAGTSGTIIPCVTATDTDVFFEGCNVRVTNGTGDTRVKNGLGNLIVGYDETNDISPDRSGSHNLVVGMGHSYPSVSGFVAGYQNTIGVPYSSISGGYMNTIGPDGGAASITGGEYNTATGIFSTVSGGRGRTASGADDWVAGGLFEPN